MLKSEKDLEKLNTPMKIAKQHDLSNGSCLICEAFSKASRIFPQKYEFLIPKDIGYGHFRQISTKNNVLISEYEMCYKSNMNVMGTSDESNIDICFCLGEGVSWESQDKHKELEVNNGETFISINRHGLERICYNKNCKFNFIGIKIPVYRFEKLIDEYLSLKDIEIIRNSIGCFSKYPITPSVRVIIQQLLNCPYKNSMLEMYTDAKLLELLSVYFNELILQSDIKNTSTVKLSRTDIKSIAKAKEILDKSISNPPYCASLSKMVYLSESKLEKGFKEVFGMPIHTYVIDKRLETALFLFENGQEKVSEVATIVGYGNMSHFSAAFRKKYGMNPREYIKNNM